MREKEEGVERRETGGKESKAFNKIHDNIVSGMKIVAAECIWCAVFRYTRY